MKLDVNTGMLHKPLTACHVAIDSAVAHGTAFHERSPAGDYRRCDNTPSNSSRLLYRMDRTPLPFR